MNDLVLRQPGSTLGLVVSAEVVARRQAGDASLMAEPAFYSTEALQALRSSVRLARLRASIERVRRQLLSEDNF